MSSRERRKHIPQRSCVICREKQDKRQLTRLVRRASDNKVIIDPTGKANGRGAYLCPRVGCWEEAAGGQQLGQALKIQLTDEDRQTITRQHKLLREQK